MTLVEIYGAHPIQKVSHGLSLCSLKIYKQVSLVLILRKNFEEAIRIMIGFRHFLRLLRDRINPPGRIGLLLTHF
jgi:hypothetical protein